MACLPPHEFNSQRAVLNFRTRRVLASPASTYVEVEAGAAVPVEAGAPPPPPASGFEQPITPATKATATTANSEYFFMMSSLPTRGQRNPEDSRETAPIRPAGAGCGASP